MARSSWRAASRSRRTSSAWAPARSSARTPSFSGYRAEAGRIRMARCASGTTSCWASSPCSTSTLLSGTVLGWATPRPCSPASAIPAGESLARLPRRAGARRPAAGAAGPVWAAAPVPLRAVARAERRAAVGSARLVTLTRSPWCCRRWCSCANPPPRPSATRASTWSHLDGRRRCSSAASCSGWSRSRRSRGWSTAFVRPDEVYPLYGVRYWCHGVVRARRTPRSTPSCSAIARQSALHAVDRLPVRPPAGAERVELRRGSQARVAVPDDCR